MNQTNAFADFSVIVLPLSTYSDEPGLETVLPSQLLAALAFGSVSGATNTQAVSSMSTLKATEKVRLRFLFVRFIRNPPLNTIFHFIITYFSILMYIVLKKILLKNRPLFCGFC